MVLVGLDFCTSLLAQRLLLRVLTTTVLICLFVCFFLWFLVFFLKETVFGLFVYLGIYLFYLRAFDHI